MSWRAIREPFFHRKVPLDHHAEIGAEGDGILDRVLWAIFTRVLVKIENRSEDRILPGRRDMKLVLLFHDRFQRRTFIDKDVIAQGFLGKTFADGFNTGSVVMHILLSQVIFVVLSWRTNREIAKS